MDTQTFVHLNMHRPLLAGGIAAILVSGIAIASLAISAQGSGGGIAPAEPLHAGAAPVFAAPGPNVRAYRCGDECGVIESTRNIETSDEWTRASASGRNHEITIRLRDGSMRVVRDANPARWRNGERVTVIAGVN